MRILAVDPGEKNIGTAISDPSGVIANPLNVIRHAARNQDADAIVQLALEQGAGRIIVGQSLDDEDQPTFQGRQARRLAGAIRARTDLPVELWDEYESTKTAQRAGVKMRIAREKRRGHRDDIAAAVILQSYLDEHAK